MPRVKKIPKFKPVPLDTFDTDVEDGESETTYPESQSTNMSHTYPPSMLSTLDSSGYPHSHSDSGERTSDVDVETDVEDVEAHNLNEQDIFEEMLENVRKEWLLTEITHRVS